MATESTKKTKKNDTEYCCKMCDFKTCKKTDYNRHTLTIKHTSNFLATADNIKNEKKIFANFVKKSLKIDLVYGDTKRSVINMKKQKYPNRNQNLKNLQKKN